MRMKGIILSWNILYWKSIFSQKYCRKIVKEFSYLFIKEVNIYYVFYTHMCKYCARINLDEKSIIEYELEILCINKNHLTSLAFYTMTAPLLCLFQNDIFDYHASKTTANIHRSNWKPGYACGSLFASANWTRMSNILHTRTPWMSIFGAF